MVHNIIKIKSITEEQPEMFVEGNKLFPVDDDGDERQRLSNYTKLKD